MNPNNHKSKFTATIIRFCANNHFMCGSKIYKTMAPEPNASVSFIHGKQATCLFLLNVYAKNHYLIDITPKFLHKYVSCSFSHMNAKFCTLISLNIQEEGYLIFLSYLSYL